MNTIYLQGVISQEPYYMYKSINERFYHTEVSTARLSGTTDKIPCVISEIFLSKIKYKKNACMKGEIRTRNVQGDDGKIHLEIYVFVMDVSEYEQDENCVNLTGFLCKNPKYRETPQGRQITDLIVASDRMHGKSDYIPCIAWGRNAIKSSEFAVGTKVMITGRLQSREYTKTFESGESETKVAYELSISMIDVVEEKED